MPDGEVSKSLSRMKNNVFSGLASATVAAGRITASVGRASGTAPADDEVMYKIEELGLNDKRSAERDLLFSSYQYLIGKCATDNTATPEGLPLERFVIDMLQRGFTPQWADAAFRAFDTKRRGMLNQYEFALAVCALHTTRDYTNDSTWMQLRRRVVFSYYDRNRAGKITPASFDDFLSDASYSRDLPEFFGIYNNAWGKNLSEYNIKQNDHNFDSVSRVIRLHLQLIHD